VKARVGDAVSFRAAGGADLDWLVDLRIRTMGAYLEASGDVLSRAEQQARVEQDFDCIRIVALEGEAIGMVKVVRRSGEWRLVQIQLDAAHQCRGIGGSIVAALLAEARAAGAAVTLSVLKVNPAKRLYDRLGFRVVDETDRSYDMRVEAAAPLDALVGPRDAT
jgi:ribosomal protein S18 acetylase RimI-like enzyme